VLTIAYLVNTKIAQRAGLKKQAAAPVEAMAIRETQRG